MLYIKKGYDIMPEQLYGNLVLKSECPQISVKKTTKRLHQQKVYAIILIVVALILIPLTSDCTASIFLLVYALSAIIQKPKLM